MPVAYRQSASTSTDGTSSTTVAKTLGTSVLAGSRLLAFVEWGAIGATDINTVGDNINGTGGWARVAGSFAADSSNHASGEVWECRNSGAGTITVTATFAAGQTFRGLCVHEVTGADTTVAALAAAAQVQTGTAVVSPDITPSSDGCYIFGACTQNSDLATQPTAGGSFALRETPGNGTTTAVCGTEDQVQGTAAAVHAAFGFASSKTGTVHVVAIKASGTNGPLTLYASNPIQGGSNAGLLAIAAPTASTSTSGWTVGTTIATQYSRSTYNTEVPTANFTATAQPSGAPVNLGEDCFRLSAQTSGVFSAGTWYSAVSVIAVTSGGIQDGQAQFRYWRSLNPDGTAATEITQGIMVGSRITELSTTVAQSSSASTQVSTQTFNNEYLFLQLGWETL